MEDVVNTGHCVTDGLGVADITDVELHLFGVLRVLGLKLMAHIVLLLLVTGEDADFLPDEDGKVQPNVTSPAPLTHKNIRGREYYRKDKQ